MKLQKILQTLETHFPPAMAEEWDNPGLLVGHSDREIRKIFVALDATDETILEAAAWGADLMLTHHPLLFSSVRKINDGDLIGRRIIALIESGISCYAMHTNYDICGMSALNARQLGLLHTEALVPAEREGMENAEQKASEEICGLGCIGDLPEAVSLTEFAKEVRRIMELPAVRCYVPGAHTAEDPSVETFTVRRVAVCGGSGKSVIRDALEKRAEVMVTGDIDYHTGIDTAAKGMALIDAGHYGTEHIFIADMVQRCRTWFPSCEVGGSSPKDPYFLV